MRWWCGVGLGKKKVDSGQAQVNHVSISSSFKINLNSNLSNFVSWLERPVSSEVTSVLCLTPGSPGSLANISHHVVTSESSESRESSGLAVLCLKPFMSGDSQGWPALPHVTDELDLSPLEHVPLSSLRSTFFSQRKTVNFILQQKLPSIFDFSKVQSNVNTS